MNNQPTAAAVNAGATTGFPQKHTLVLSLVLPVPNQEQADYLLAPDGTMQLGFIADLLDVLNFELELGVESINGITAEQVRQFFQKTL